MIKLSQAQLTDSLPRVIAKEPWAMAMSAAVNKQIEKILAAARRAMLYADIYNTPEQLLDVLAAEMQIPSYSSEYGIDLKRTLVLNGLSYWSKAGTVQATEDVLKSIFEDAEISEWFQYSGEPGYFKITTANPNITEQNISDFKAAAEKVKRLSAWLEGVELILGVDPMVVSVGFILTEAESIEIIQE